MDWVPISVFDDMGMVSITVFDDTGKIPIIILDDIGKVPTAVASKHLLHIFNPYTNTVL
jgi:hypothetical protein